MALLSDCEEERRQRLVNESTVLHARDFYGGMGHRVKLRLTLGYKRLLLRDRSSVSGYSVAGRRLLTHHSAQNLRLGIVGWERE